MRLTTLKKRAEFLRLRGGARCPTPPFVLETRPRTEPEAARGPEPEAARGPEPEAGRGPEPEAAQGPPRFGITVTKAIGGAVERNRIRRRLKAAVRAVAAVAARPGQDYVLIARRSALDMPFEALKKDLERAFHRVHHASRSPQTDPKRKVPP